MNNKSITFVKNFSYSLSSNLISLIISLIIVLIIPKLIGLEDYGYWQLYLFYSTYVGFLHFGWNDGIYLRYGGKEYSKLNKNLLFSQFWTLFIFQLILGSIIIILSINYFADSNKLFILIMTAICMLIVNVRFMLTYILQCTNKIKEYAKITIMEKVIFIVLIVLFLLIGVNEFKLLIVADLIGKLISLVYTTYYCKEIVYRKVSTFYFSFNETIENISVGIKLMLANIAGMLIVGSVRFGIERNWSISTFGKISLTLSVSNLILVLINAIGIIMYPVLRRTNEEKLPKIYSTIRTVLMFPLLGLLLFYFPLKEALTYWLPNYKESFMYMALIFPMCVYEGKMSLLINTYLKTLRKEKLMLYVNIISVLLSIIVTFLIAVIVKNLTLTIVSIVVLLSFRSALAEVYLSKILNISVYKDILLEMLMTFIFIITAWFSNSWNSILYYFIAYVLYLIIKRNEIFGAARDIKRLVNKKS
ncbi:hypothetical protein [Niallia hominis]|uniref:Uncharacterized protein n=1 Tax=Niallia hominis TaxID=3133173 RepID=A0ABV1EUJ3_9BACI